MTEKLISIGEFAKRSGVSTQTLRRWEAQNKLIPANKLESGKRFYSESQLNKFLNKKEAENRITIGYCRVSSNKQKDDLERQINNVKQYMIAKGYSFDIITDIGSGINYNKKGLNSLLKLVISNKVDKIVILYKDRLLRFGFELFENICKEYNVDIEIIDNSVKSQEQELVEDLFQVITEFNCNLQGKRASKIKKMIKELVESENNKES